MRRHGKARVCGSSGGGAPLEPDLELAHHLDEPLKAHEPLAVVGPVGGGDGHVDVECGGHVACCEGLAELRELPEDLRGDLACAELGLALPSLY